MVLIVYFACFRKQVSVVRSVDCLSACRGKGSTLFLYLNGYDMLGLLFMQLLCALACLYLCILVDENVVINTYTTYI